MLDNYVLAVIIDIGTEVEGGVQGVNTICLRVGRNRWYRLMHWQSNTSTVLC